MDFTNMDKAVNGCFIGLWKEAKKENKICFTNIDVKNRGHLCILKLAQTLHDIYNYDIYVDVNSIEHWYLKSKWKMNFIKTKTENAIDITYFLKLLSDGLELEEKLFAEAFNEYYARRK